MLYGKCTDSRTTAVTAEMSCIMIRGTVFVPSRLEHMNSETCVDKGAHLVARAE